MSLESWIEKERAHAAAMMLKSISPVDVVKSRPGFHQSIVPKPGAIVASPVLADWDPEPDYFFHWYRDSALVIGALRAARDLVPDAERHVADFVRFSLDLATLDGRGVVPEAEPDFRKFLRGDLDTVHGEAVAADTRVNPDGTLDITGWARPQHDGPALRALALMRWGVADDEAAALIAADLAFVRHRARKPCFDIWEEEKGLHYYTLAVSRAALALGADLLDARGGKEQAAACRAEADAVALLLDGYWRPEGFIASRAAPSPKQLDASVLLAINHAGIAPDAKAMTTLDRLAALFAGLYPINRGRGAPALGRYEADRYFGGNPWVLTTLAAAELCYRAGDLARGDGFLETVQAFTPGSGDLSEQFGRDTGRPVSARHLAWSYAAFLTATGARKSLSGALSSH